jgi:hypothetical protein
MNLNGERCRTIEVLTIGVAVFILIHAADARFRGYDAFYSALTDEACDAGFASASTVAEAFGGCASGDATFRSPTADDTTTTGRVAGGHTAAVFIQDEFCIVFAHSELPADVCPATITPRRGGLADRFAGSTGECS